jgi:transcriptional regulator with XRE-family HTH domain
MKTVNKRKATGLLGQMIEEVDPVKLAKTRNRMIVAAKIADAMKAKDLNQKQFAKLMGRTESEISDWLSGDRNFTIDTLFDIGQALGITFLSETIQYTTSDVYEPASIMTNEPLEEPMP